MHQPKKLEIFDFDALPSRQAHQFAPVKPELKHKSLNKLLAFIWSQDPQGYDHPRYRVQVTFAILLQFQLGMSPHVALSEGLRYGDVDILLTRKDGMLRTILMIKLSNHKKGAKWLEGLAQKYPICNIGALTACRRTMILADDPSNWHACAVTLFLAMALADHALDGIHSSQDLLRLYVPAWPAWGVLPVCSEVVGLPVIRRVGTRSRVLSSHSMKGTALYKMMQAQIDRLKDPSFSTAMQLDIKHAVRREQRRMSHCVTSDESSISSPLSQRAWPILIGRSQGRIVFELLHSELVAYSLGFQSSDADGPSCSEPRAHIIPNAVACQLKYDESRRDIISCLYGKLAATSQIFDAISAFEKAADVVAPEPFFTDAGPGPDGSCPHCATRLARIPLKYHILRCTQLKKIKLAELELAERLHNANWICKWNGCVNLVHLNLDHAAAHMSEHVLDVTPRCHWNDCGYMATSRTDLQQHLSMCHDVYTAATIPIRANFCFQCGVWKNSEMGWELHMLQHVKEPSIIYGPIMIDGILAAPRRCPFCMNQGSFTQFENHTSYLDHIEGHIRSEIETAGSVQCPHQTCKGQGMGMRDFTLHLQHTHGICIS